MCLDTESTSNELLTNQREKTSIWLDNNGLVCVQWEKGEQIDKYPSVWLRDNCQCNECFDNSSRQRKLLLRHLDAEIEPACTSFNHETNEVLQRIHFYYQLSKTYMVNMTLLNYFQIYLLSGHYKLARWSSRQVFQKMVKSSQFYWKRSTKQIGNGR